MPSGLPVSSLSTGYNPAASATDSALHQKASTAVTTVQRLGALCTGGVIPTVFPTNVPQGRPPRHLLIQVPAAAVNGIYVSWDNNTPPAVGGPGFELNAGGTLKMELAGDGLLGAHSGGQYPVAVGSAIQIIAAAATVVLLSFSE